MDSNRMTLLPLTAGPLTMMFDTDIAFLRYVRFGGQELVRGVFVAVRDRDWNTIPFSIGDLNVDRTADTFAIHFFATSLKCEIAFRWQGTIDGTCEGVVHYRFKGECAAPFYRNRIGLCVLHPTGECAGKSCQIEHVDGTSTRGIFPMTISPHQPFKNVRAISHSVYQGGRVHVSMTGDTFEMEDQRNWTDASYKTYSTPLDLPFPVRVEKGTILEQSVTIALLGAELPDGSSVVVNNGRCKVTIDWTQPIRRPEIGFQWPKQSCSVPSAVVHRLHTIRPDHFRVDLWLNRPEWHAELNIAIEVAQSTEAKLEIAVFTDNASSDCWHQWLQSLQRVRARVARILLFHTTEKTTPPDLVAAALGSLRAIDRELQIVVGTNGYFAELNRGRPTPIDDGPVCYSINPQVHAFDNLSLSETIEAQRATVESAVQTFSSDVVISPITLRPRFNPNATSIVDRAAELEAAIDPRQSLGFGAAWTAGVFASLLTHPKVKSLTLYEAFGPRGVIGGDGNDIPMTTLVECVIQSEQTFRGVSSFPLRLVAFGMQVANKALQVVFGNLSSQEIEVQFCTTNGNTRVITIAAETAHIESLEEESADA
jgi:hypothetical protein